MLKSSLPCVLGHVSTLPGRYSTQTSFGGVFFGGVVLDSKKNMYVANGSKITKTGPSGQVTTFSGFERVAGVAIDDDGNIYFTDKSVPQIHKLTSDGKVNVIAGDGNRSYRDGIGLNSSFNEPTGIAIDKGKNLIIADCLNHRIRKVTPEGVVSTIAGSGDRGSVDAVGVAAQFNFPTGVAVDEEDNIYVADFESSRIRKITASGMVSTVFQMENPKAVVVSGDGYLYITAKTHVGRRLRLESGH